MDQQISRSERASIFHASLAGLIADQAAILRNKHRINRVGLTGGVFQNRLLTEYALTLLSKLGFEVYLHADIPSGDGGISFGQLMEAAHRNHPVSEVKRS
jgi:hydrogenase maturation protein HypF